MNAHHRIEEVLKEKGITKRWLAKKVGRSEQAISSICKGKSNPPLPLLFNIAEVLEISPCEILDMSKVNKEYIKRSIEKAIAEMTTKEKNSNFLLGLEDLLNDLKDKNQE